MGTPFFYRTPSQGLTICIPSLVSLPQNAVDKWLPYSLSPHPSTPALCSLMGGRGEHNRAFLSHIMCVCGSEREREIPTAASLITTCPGD